ncbi:DUF4199 domain-containing protein [Alistipes sp.]|uniref:DUF4199 domain-containing protein n=1 Tax=Alistipes sp. TaxID=1872444 RepID=UPI0025BC466F|nr:DUF4199 domain-containing protein [Alistipes sp.]
MKKTNFWNDAAKAGVIMALVAILFNVLGLYVQHMLLSLLSLVVFVLLLSYLTRRRVERFGAEGYSYGQCLGYMVGVMLCAGFIEGAFMAVASNWLFVERYQALIAPSISFLENSGFYTGEQIEMMMKLMRSPLTLIFSGMLASAIKGGFFGLFIAAFTKRDPDVFSDDATR